MHRAADDQSQVPGAASEKSRRRSVTLQQAIWIVPIDDTHCEEMRLTVYPEEPSERDITALMWIKLKNGKENRTTGAFMARSRATCLWKTKLWWKVKGRSSIARLNIPVTGTERFFFAQNDSRRHR